MEEQLELPFNFINNWTLLPWEHYGTEWQIRYKDYCSMNSESYWVAQVYPYSSQYEYEVWLDGRAFTFGVLRGVSPTLEGAKRTAETIIRNNKPTNYVKRKYPWKG